MARPLLLACLLLVAVMATMSAAQGYNPQYYPNIASGWGGVFHNSYPNGNFGGCRYWCRSSYTRQYYCCTTPQQSFNQHGGFNQGGFNQGGFNHGGFNHGGFNQGYF